ncbi:MAG TPA: ATP-binding protein, partial [Polyangia bacterium]|nr:ATP-binding protein [Polyangia bacterium]
MLSAVWKTIRREKLLFGGDHLVVAVSGGPDSMALMSALWELAPRLELRLAVAIVDHGLRPEARAEAALVAERAAALGLPFHRLCVDVPAARAAPGRAGSLQAVARALRLGALEDLARRLGAGRVALG